MVARNLFDDGGASGQSTESEAESSYKGWSDHWYVPLLSFFRRLILIP